MDFYFASPCPRLSGRDLGLDLWTSVIGHLLIHVTQTYGLPCILTKTKRPVPFGTGFFLCMPVPLIIMPNFSLKIKQNVTHCLFSFYLNIFLRRLI